MTSNYHLARIPALGACLEEMRDSGAVYADAVVANARALGEALAAEGVTVVSNGQQYTNSHTILVCPGAFETGQEAALALEEANIIVTATELPACWGGHGLRLGVQEMTHAGAKPTDMATVATLVASILLKRSSAVEIRPLVEKLAPSFWYE
jgi:glycine hydroxymethyltransferase